MKGNSPVNISKNKMNQVDNKGLLHWQGVTMFLVLYDIAAVTVAFFFALLLRFDFRFSMIPAVYFEPWIKFAPIYAIICILILTLPVV